MSRANVGYSLRILVCLGLILGLTAVACGGSTPAAPAATVAPPTAAPVQDAGITAEEVAKMMEEAKAESTGLSDEEVQKLVEQRVAEAAAAAAAAAASAAAAAAAEKPKAVVTDPETEKPYYEGKTIKVIANHPPGGGADLNARVVARHIGRFLPGNPKTVVLNKVGGASLVGAHYVWNASDDGLTLGVFTGVNPDRQLLQPGVQYDLLEFKNIVGLQVRPVVAYIHRDAPYRRIQDAVGKGSDPTAPRFTLGQELICTSGSMRYRALKEWLDLPMDIKYGLPGGRVPTMQQLERHDIDLRDAGMWYTLARDRPGWQTDDTGGNGPDAFLQIFFVLSLPELQLRHNGEIDVPEDSMQIMDLLNDEQKKLWRIFTTDLGPTYRAVQMPPSTPDELVTLMQDAAWEMVHDPEFLADYDKILAGDTVTPTKGTDLRELYVASLGRADITLPIIQGFLPECEFNE